VTVCGTREKPLPALPVESEVRPGRQDRLAWISPRRSPLYETASASARTRSARPGREEHQDDGSPEIQLESPPVVVAPRRIGQP
jgi:hypothetical protein